LEPCWAIRTGATPFWMLFNEQRSAQALASYLDRAEAFDRIYMLLFSHGIDSIGVTSIDRWRTLLNRCRQGGEFVGVDERAYPHDFAIFARYSPELAKKIKPRYLTPPIMTLAQLEAFVA
jgi:hypothetical protein